MVGQDMVQGGSNLKCKPMRLSSEKNSSMFFKKCILHFQRGAPKSEIFKVLVLSIIPVDGTNIATLLKEDPMKQQT